MENILVTGALGQLGTDLVPALKNIYGEDHVISTDIHPSYQHLNGPFHILDIMNPKALGELIRKYRVKQIYHLAAVLSARAEKQPELSWKINMEGLLNVLQVAREEKISKVFWPSSIAVFGPDSPKIDTPQFTIMNPSTIYGISKLAGERWCAYHNENALLDIRSLRYPGLIGSNSLPGGGTTDYAVDIFFKATEKGSYSCFLKEDTRLPMMYMDDAVRGTIELMEADQSSLKVRSSYNIAGVSFTPKELADSIKERIPQLQVSYEPDYRQKIATSWPQSIDDTHARSDWDWKPQFSLKAITRDMLLNLSKKNCLMCNPTLQHVPSSPRT